MAPHHWLLRVCVLARKMLVYKIFKQQQFFLLWKNSKLLLNAIRLKVKRFLSDGTEWWHRFWWKILRSALLSSALTTASLCGSEELLAVCCSGRSCSEEVTGGREEERMKERNLLPSWEIPFSPYSLYVLGKHLCQDDLKFSSIFQLGFFFPFNHFLVWPIFLPVCSHPCMHRQSWTSNPCQLTHHMGIQRPRT